MSARARVWIIVALAAAAAVGTVVGVTLATRNDVQSQAEHAAAFRRGPDGPARGGAAGARSAAGVAGRHGPPAADSRRALSAQRPRPARARPRACALRPAGRRDPGVAGGGAGPAGLPVRRQVSGSPPPGYSAGSAALRPELHAGHQPGRVQLLRGAAYQQALRPVSAEREFAAAAKAAPNDPEALTAAAVGLYDKDRPALAFSRLGPLARRFPRAQTVRFHLGLLLIYFGDLPRARRELALARAQGPRTPLGKRAETLLKAGRKP